MSTYQRPMFNVFRKVNFDDSIEKIEWRTYYPYTRSFRNNDIIEIVINQSTLFDATYDSQLLVSGKIIKTGDGDVSFVNNASAFMFSSVKYVLGGGSKEMELVQDPDCSRRDENERPSTVDVRLEIEAAQGFPENTRAYCIIIHDCIMEYLPLDNIVNNLKA
ncbi:hypothetical protein NQ315_017378 [Exocentrus adspersus]|uniref:Double jelly roll-like domain-containing protein n=1 Tax=Exocentrus adspersus TaxID=1586481 RepID=A0AAV8VKX3_9CUCU|nr:hypothetical protein NQ315_017378 [Exocentrus adspersus]